MTTTIRTQVLFTEETVHGSFTDALYFTPEEFALIKDADLDLMKQQRIDAWIESVENPPPTVEPTKEDLEKQLVELDLIRADLISKIEEKL